RLAGAKVHQVAPGDAQLFRLVHHGERGGNFDAVDTVAERLRHGDGGSAHRLDLADFECGAACVAPSARSASARAGMLLMASSRGATPKRCGSRSIFSASRCCTIVGTSVAIEPPRRAISFTSRQPQYENV